MEQELILKMNFSCEEADDFSAEAHLIDENRIQGLMDGWHQAIKHYCPDDIDKITRKFHRKITSVYNFHDLLSLHLRFKNSDGCWDEIAVTTNYAELVVDS